MANSVEVWPFREKWYILSVMDDRLLWDRKQAEAECRSAGLPWSRAYRTCRVEKQVRGGESVVVTWRLR